MCCISRAPERARLRARRLTVDSKMRPIAGAVVQNSGRCQDEQASNQNRGSRENGSKLEELQTARALALDPRAGLSLSPGQNDDRRPGADEEAEAGGRGIRTSRGKGDHKARAVARAWTRRHREAQSLEILQASDSSARSAVVRLFPLHANTLLQQDSSDSATTHCPRYALLCWTSSLSNPAAGSSSTGLAVIFVFCSSKRSSPGLERISSRLGTGRLAIRQNGTY